MNAPVWIGRVYSPDCDMAKHKAARAAAPRIVMEEGRPWGIVVFVLSLAVVVIGSGLATLQYLQERALHRQSEAVAAQAMLNSKVAQLASQKNTLSAQIARLKRNAQIDRRTQRQLREEILMQQAQIAAFRRKVAFFESILQPDEQPAGVLIHNVAVQPLAERKGFELELILTQSGNHHRSIKGTVNWQWENRDGAVQPALNADTCQPDGRRPRIFEFKYFQVVTIRCVSEDALPPAWISMTVKAEGYKAVLRSLKIR